MTQPTISDQPASPGRATRRRLLSPEAGALAAGGLALTGLAGQGMVGTAIQLLLLGQGASSPGGFTLSAGIGALLVSGLSVLLALPALRGTGPVPWAGHVARAAVLLAALLALSGLALCVAAVWSPVPWVGGGLR